MAISGRAVNPFRVIAAAAAPLLAALMCVAPAHAESRCSDVKVPVSLAPKLPKAQKIYGRLCLPAGAVPTTLQILIHGSNYDHDYWDFPGFNGRYSYVRAMNDAGRATLAIDQIGVGKSSHPPSILVTETVNANSVHDLVTAVRAGGVGPRFSKVVLVGHSFGSLTAWLEAATFQDVDGVLASGAAHSSGDAYLQKIIAHTRPALLDPVTRANIPPLDLGYISIPGARAEAFYYLPNADPAVIAADEATRSEWSLGGALTVSMYIPKTTAITVPVLIVNGIYDMPFCKQGGGGAATDCASDAALRAFEAPYFSPATPLEAVVVPNAGHVLNLHRNADYFFNSALSWFARYFPL